MLFCCPCVFKLFFSPILSYMVQVLPSEVKYTEGDARQRDVNERRI